MLLYDTQILMLCFNSTPPAGFIGIRYDTLNSSVKKFGMADFLKCFTCVKS